MRSFFVGLLSLIVLTGCSKKSVDDYMKSAEENLKNNKVQEAVADLEGLLKDHKESDKAPEALTKLASLYQNKMVKNLSDNESLEKSVKLYRQVFDEYPNSSQAPKALFMSAFIQANELQKFHPAEMGYRLFLQKFPDHELAASAKEELNNIGLSPEEILKRKSPASL
jgi:TolA-binding protein